MPRRGDILVATLHRDLGKPRPALVVQSDALNLTGPHTYVVCPITTHLAGADRYRVAVGPDAANGLRAPSEVMVDKVTSLGHERLREPIGRLDGAAMRAVDRALVAALGLDGVDNESPAPSPSDG